MPGWSRDQLLGGQFDFLNNERLIGFPPDWTPSGASHLWQYNLHYFEYLWSLPFEEARDVALDWIERHPFGPDQVGWEPYPLSLRIQNWCLFFLGLHRDATESDQSFSRSLLGSIVLQVATLERNLEFHLLGNHLFENAATLALAGAFLSLPVETGTRKRGLELLKCQLEEQVLGDGTHFERSPMYQARLTYVLSQLVATGDGDLLDVCNASLKALSVSLAYQMHPDGEIALFNDAALGIAPSPGALGIASPAPGAFSLREAGYYGSMSPDGHYILCDAGPIGPDYLPGHAHGDIFSFELSLRSKRVVVDSGVFGYEAGEMRNYCRSTRAHNTVEIGQTDQCEFWGSFRVARRGRPFDVRFEPDGEAFLLGGSHDGYTRLAGRAVHERTFRWKPHGALIARDRITSQRELDAVSRIHLHPECSVERVGDRKASVAFSEGRVLVAWQGDGRLEIERSYFCPEFGVRMENRCLAFHMAAPGESILCITPEEFPLSFQI
jgi:uncharacterized heparinase superfamily protein